MRRTRRLALAIGAAFVLAVVPAFSQQQASTVIDRVVATVDGEVITLHDLWKAELPLFGKILLPGEGEVRTTQDRARERQLLDRLVEERLLLRRAKERGITASSSEVDDAIERLKSDRKLTSEMFEKALAERGIAPAQYRERISSQITVSKLFSAERRSREPVSPEDVAAWYREHRDDYTTPEQVRIRHLLVMKREGEDSRGEADRLASLLAAGGDFEETARKHSQDSLQRRGEVSGWIRRGDFLPELESVIFDLEPGQVSRVVETSMGYHILKVEEKQAARTRPLEEVGEEIAARLAEQRSEERYQQWLEEVKKGAVIDIKL
jgi:peptidyl-prolyl cis-trans isomerase SurA